MKLEPLGEAAFILRELGPWEAWRLCDALGGAAVPGIIEAVSAYDTAAVYVDPEVFQPADLAVWASRTAPEKGERVRRTHRIPVCYELGEDMQEVCSRLELRSEELRDIHCSTAYTCYAIGFSPGFPYLGYLSERLSGVPRRESPRVRVPRGSVGITGTQTCVYPQESPGGWALIGRTPLVLVDLSSNYFPIKAGDTVAFEPIDRSEYQRLEGSRL